MKIDVFPKGFFIFALFDKPPRLSRPSSAEYATVAAERMATKARDTMKRTFTKTSCSHRILSFWLVNERLSRRRKHNEAHRLSSAGGAYLGNPMRMLAGIWVVVALVVSARAADTNWVQLLQRQGPVELGPVAGSERRRLF